MDMESTSGESVSPARLVTLRKVEEARKNAAGGKQSPVARPPDFNAERRSAWERVSGTWRAAEHAVRLARSYGRAKASKLLHGRASDDVRRLRVLSCHGDQWQGGQTPPCPARRFVAGRTYHFCGECGCGDRVEARISESGSTAQTPRFDPEAYDKLDHPHLDCPRRRQGFSNAAPPGEEITYSDGR